mmetsp:Transcript_28757/g.66373  ORF Transcript_28757/g.66373 Transcript_28757/m.66373 type:complete len:274 (-) Transcript_28757:1483-2304(-)
MYANCSSSGEPSGELMQSMRTCRCSACKLLLSRSSHRSRISTPSSCDSMGTCRRKGGRFCVLVVDPEKKPRGRLLTETPGALGLRVELTELTEAHIPSVPLLARRDGVRYAASTSAASVRSAVSLVRQPKSASGGVETTMRVLGPSLEGSQTRLRPSESVSRSIPSRNSHSFCRVPVCCSRWANAVASSANSDGSFSLERSLPWKARSRWRMRECRRAPPLDDCGVVLQNRITTTELGYCCLASTAALAITLVFPHPGAPNTTRGFTFPGWFK